MIKQVIKINVSGPRASGKTTTLRVIKTMIIENGGSIVSEPRSLRFGVTREQGLRGLSFELHEKYTKSRFYVTKKIEYDSVSYKVRDRYSPKMFILETTDKNIAHAICRDKNLKC